MDQEANQVHVVKLANLDLTDHKAHLDCEVQLVKREPEDHRDLLATKAQKEVLGLKVLTAG